VLTSSLSALTYAVPMAQLGANAAVAANAKSQKGSLRPSVVHTHAAADSSLDVERLSHGTGG
jgi:hypothetical protein